ncbi:Protein phosphatase 1 regulatory subunit 7 [Portunus trituberculatus]|uniref:Dynein axonemal assembly factor 1 homolog n=1 Tax=Portunus trituberculatus TaxID=210409 RepID=A0A5B7HUD9_PORTR|nr:Protein phosphatase 1 regulatory subunit 7 [Portunus trituberculatus]
MMVWTALDNGDPETPDPDDDECEDLVILDPNAVDVDLNHRRIDKIKNLESLRCVETLCLRWNLIKKIENLHTLTMLKELELYDNQITVIENLSALVNLE